MAEFEGETMTEESKPIEHKDDKLKSVTGGLGIENSEPRKKYSMITFGCSRDLRHRKYVWYDAYAPAPEECPNCNSCGAKMVITHLEP